MGFKPTKLSQRICSPPPLVTQEPSHVRRAVSLTQETLIPRSEFFISVCFSSLDLSELFTVLIIEHRTGLEPATSTLARWYSTN